MGAAGACGDFFLALQQDVQTFDEKHSTLSLKVAGAVQVGGTLAWRRWFSGSNFPLGAKNLFGEGSNF